MDGWMDGWTIQHGCDNMTRKLILEEEERTIYIPQNYGSPQTPKKRVVLPLLSYYTIQGPTPLQTVFEQF